MTTNPNEFAENTDDLEISSLTKEGSGEIPPKIMNRRGLFKIPFNLVIQPKYVPYHKSCLG